MSPSASPYYWALGDALGYQALQEEAGQGVSGPLGTEVKERTESDSDDSDSGSLTHTAPSSATVTLSDGRAMTRRELYLEAIQVNPADANALYRLGSMLQSGETVELPTDGTVRADKKWLLAEAHHLLPNVY